MKTECVNLFVLFTAIAAPIITIFTGTLLSITSIGDWLFRKIENKKLKTLKIFAQVCSAASVFSTIVLIILGVLAFVNAPQIVHPLIVSVATADELTCFIGHKVNKLPQKVSPLHIAKYACQLFLTLYSIYALDTNVLIAAAILTEFASITISFLLISYICSKHMLLYTSELKAI